MIALAAFGIGTLDSTVVGGLKSAHESTQNATGKLHQIFRNSDATACRVLLKDSGSAGGSDTEGVSDPVNGAGP